VFPGQEKDFSIIQANRGVKLYEQDKSFFAQEGEKSAVKATNKERAKSAVPSKTSGAFSFNTKGKTFEDLMNSGVERLRVNPTFTSEVLPITSSTPDLSNLATGVNPNYDTAEKWKIDENDIIPEKVNNSLKK